MDKAPVSLKMAMFNALLDTFEVLLYGGLPVTGILGFLQLIAVQIPSIAVYIPYAGVAINAIVFYFVRLKAYLAGTKELKVQL